MVTKVKKFYLIASDFYRRKILSLLYDLGDIQLVELGDKLEESELNDLNYYLAKVKFCIDFLANYRLIKKINFKDKINKVLAPKIEISVDQVEKTIQTLNWRRLADRVEELDQQLNDGWVKIKKIKEEKEKFFAWKNIDFDFEQAKSLQGFSFVLGKILLTEEDVFIQKMIEKFNLLEAKKISQDEKYSYFYIFFAKELSEEINTFFEENKFQKEEINIPISPQEKLLQLDKQLVEAEFLVQSSEEELKKFAQDYEKLKIVYDWLGWQKDKEEINQMATKTTYTFFLIGWIEDKGLGHLKEKIGEITQEFEIVEVPIEENENVPILLKNKEPINDFENVTSVYGFPKYGEPDPTPFLTPFFIIFFAICLSDAGYGLILAIFSLIILKFFKLPKSTKSFFRLFLWLGLATIVAGALFGSWFCIDLDLLPASFQPVKNLILKFRLTDPVKNPITLLIFSLILGVIQIIAGFLVNMYWKIKNKMVLDGLLDNLPWVFTLSFLLIFIGSSTRMLPFNPEIIKYLILGSVLSIVLTQGRKKKNIIMKVFGGLYALYGAVGYFSDTLSYSRLLALGLSTSIIGMVMNIVAKIFSNLIPGVGVVLGVLILIGGHIFNIGISSLGAFIHSARLQFVEFFPKFMEGGGLKFRTFKKQGKYINLISEK